MTGVQTCALPIYKFWKVPNQASIAINEESKPTNTVHVLVPYEATGSAQLKATKRLDGGQLRTGSSRSV